MDCFKLLHLPFLSCGPVVRVGREKDDAHCVAAGEFERALVDPVTKSFCKQKRGCQSWPAEEGDFITVLQNSSRD